MANFGKNMRITVDRAERALAQRLFVDCLGCSVKKPMDDLEVYLFEDGFSLGAFYVDSSDALSSADHKKAPWLELSVRDPEATIGKLADLGIKPFEYTDKTHSYFCPPCGPVFRLAKL
jgi:hypothetical protein